MTQKIIAQPLGLISPDDLAIDEKYLFPIVYEMFPQKKTNLYIKDSYLIIHTIFWGKFDNCWKSDQDEFPLESLPWIVDRFENGFFKPQELGGVSDFERSLRKEFNGELIGINSMAHCCAENLPGYNIWNANRKSYIASTFTQQWDIPRYFLLEKGLLAQLKDLAEKYEKGVL